MSSSITPSSHAGIVQYGADRRRAERSGTNIQAILRFQDRMQVVQGSICDLSIGGAGFICQQAVAAQSKCTLQFALPALNQVRQTADSVRTDKWKRGNIRDEAAQNISQIVRDIDVTLPQMLRTADTASSSLSNLLPILRNISALYDVLLRVVEASRVAAPDDQVVQLQQALVTLGNARLALSDRLQNSAVALEKQVADLQKIVQSQAANIAISSAPIVIPCATPQPR